MSKSLLLAFAFLAVASAAQADLFYDTITTRTNSALTTATGYTRTGDNFLFGNAGTATSLNISQIELLAYTTAAGTYTVPVTVNLYSTVGTPNSLTAGSNAAFTNLLFTRTLTFTASPTGTAFYTLPFSNLNLTIPTTPGNVDTGFGIEFVLGANTATASGLLVPIYTNTAPTVGASSNGFYYDSNGSGVIQNSEFTNFSGYTNGNLSVRITAQAVPEPSAVAALGLGAVAFLRRRKRA